MKPDAATRAQLSETELRRLLEVGRALVSELEVESVLHQVLDTSPELTAARYAALGILDEDKQELERFLFVGVDEQRRRVIGPLPRGHGVLGELIRDPRPLRAGGRGLAPAFLRVPAGAPADDDLPWRAHRDPRRGVRQPLPDREGRRRGVHRERRAARRGAGRVGGDRDRQCTSASGRAAAPLRARARRARTRGHGHRRPFGRSRDRSRACTRADRQARARPGRRACAAGAARGRVAAARGLRGGRRAGRRGRRAPAGRRHACGQRARHRSGRARTEPVRSGGSRPRADHGRRDLGRRGAARLPRPRPRSARGPRPRASGRRCSTPTTSTC